MENAREENQDRDSNNRLGKISHRNKKEHGKNLRRRSCGTTERLNSLLAR
jgi:hypothetical protein